MWRKCLLSLGLSVIVLTACGPQLLIATANAVTQRVISPFRIRQLTRRLAEGERIERDKLVQLLQANGYENVANLRGGTKSIPRSKTCTRFMRMRFRSLCTLYPIIPSSVFFCSIQILIRKRNRPICVGTTCLLWSS